MYFRPNEINFNIIHDKFDGFHNVTNAIKIKIINEMKSLSTYAMFGFIYFINLI